MDQGQLGIEMNRQTDSFKENGVLSVILLNIFCLF